MALKQIQAIYREENKLETMSPEERLRHRQLTVKRSGGCLFCVGKTESDESSGKKQNCEWIYLLLKSGTVSEMFS